MCTFLFSYLLPVSETRCRLRSRAYHDNIQQNFGFCPSHSLEVITPALFYIKYYLSNFRFTCGLRKGPILHVGKSNGSTVLLIWETNCKMDDIKLFWWKKFDTFHESSSEGIVKDPIQVDASHYLYMTEIGPLSSNTVYSYEINVGLKRMAYDFYFPGIEYDPKDDLVPLNIAYVSDNQHVVKTFNRLVSGLVSQGPLDLFIHGGDAVQNPGRVIEWETGFYDVLAHHGVSQVVPLVLAHGNHDYNADRLNPYFIGKKRSDDWFSFSIGVTRLIILDSNTDDSEQEKFLRNELASSNQFKFVVVVVHIAPFMEFWDPRAWNQGGEKHWGEFVRVKYVPLFEKYKVSFVVSGHQHNYQRGKKNGVIYAIAGGGGGELDDKRVENWQGMYSVKKIVHHYGILKIWKKKMEWSAYDIDNNLIDKVVISPRF